MFWYVVLSPFGHPGVREHLGLGGEAWPLDPRLSMRRHADEHWKLIWVAGCAFEVCLNEPFARSYFDDASSYFPRLRLIEVGPLDAFSDAFHGIDIGRPSGGFSAADEICANAHLVERYGRFMNEKGLFGSVELFEQYMTARDGRETEDGLEYLDESLAVSVRVLRVAL